MDRVVLGLLDEAREAGLRVSVDGDKLRINGPKAGAAIAEELTARKPDVLALLNGERERGIQIRMDAFRTQIPGSGPIPFLAMSPSIVPAACLSCGESMTSSERYRCGMCAEAARQVIEEAEEARRQSGGVR